MMKLDKLIAELEARAKSDNSTKFLNYDRRNMLEAAAAIRELQREKQELVDVAWEYIDDIADFRAKLTACEEGLRVNRMHYRNFLNDISANMGNRIFIKERCEREFGEMKAEALAALKGER